MPTAEAFIRDAVRTPFGRYAGTLSSVRADDLAPFPSPSWRRNPGVDWAALDDVICARGLELGHHSHVLAALVHAQVQAVAQAHVAAAARAVISRAASSTEATSRSQARDSGGRPSL